MSEISDLYDSILRKINVVESNHETWIEALKEILDDAVKIFPSNVTYCVYTIDSAAKTSHLEVAGTNNDAYLARRTIFGQKNINDGLIGKTIKDNHSYKIYDNVHDEAWSGIYITGNPATKSELVVKIPDLLSTMPLGVINLESDTENIESDTEEKVFNDNHGLLFSFIANLAGQFKFRKDNELQNNKILNQASSLLSDRQNFTSNYIRRENLFLKLAQIAHDISKSDVFAVALHEEGVCPYEFLCFHDKYPEKLRKLKEEEQKQSVPAFAFTAHQTSTREAIGEPAIYPYELVKYPKLIESRIDSSFNYFLSICFRYEFEDNRKIAAVVLGFREVPIAHIIDRISDKLKFLAKVISRLTNQFEHIDDRDSLISAIASFSNENTTAQNRNKLKDIDRYLNDHAGKLSKILHSTKCIFYQLINNDLESATALRDMGSDIGGESNIFWMDYFSKSPQHMDIFKKIESEGGCDEFEIIVPITSDSNQHDKYNIYVRSVGRHTGIIFLSLKKFEEYHKTLKLSEIRKTILNAKISFVESFVKDWLIGNSIEYKLEGFKKVVHLWLQQVSDNSPKDKQDSSKDKQECENLLFKAVHTFLERWHTIAGTKHSAILLVSEENKNTLEITKASMDHLNANHLPVLKLDVGQSILNDPKIGLTQRVWKDRKSILSFSVRSSGSEECRNFWKEIAGNPDDRFFAGVLIKSNKSPLGVLTINGLKPSLDVQKLSMEPSILPMLEIIAEELGNQIHLIKSKK